MPWPSHRAGTWWDPEQVKVASHLWPDAVRPGPARVGVDLLWRERVSVCFNRVFLWLAL